MQALLVSAYLVAIITANLAVATFGPSVSIACAFLFIGFDLTAKDRLQDYWQGKQFVPKMLCLIAAGSLLSYVLNANVGSIAFASFVAFAIANIADAIIYQQLRQYTWFERANASNLLGSAVDSLLFPALAFGLPLLWFIVVGQFLAKVCGGLVWSLLMMGLKYVTLKICYNERGKRL